jgi:endonuclease/exonuclease/phosphatase family metal-dependent hydrolase
MTFNLRFENDFDGENHWHRRRDLLVRTIVKDRPLVVGTQEGKPSQLNYLSEHLVGYRISAGSRLWDDNCQYPTLYYRDDSLRLVEDGEFWLSRTPQIHLSKNWGSAFPRMMSYALLERVETDRQFWFSVTHLDHISQRARIEGARMVRSWARDRGAPTILVGDFNDVPGSEVHRILTRPRGPFHDSWECLSREEDHHSYTQHGFSGVPAKGRIDWILATPEFRAVDAGLGRDHESGRYPSDHFPYWADLELGEAAVKPFS